MAKFSERLRELRKERGLKQREMAEICGLKLRGYQQYEYNESLTRKSRVWWPWRTSSASAWTISWAAATSGRSAADRPRKRQDPPPLW